jgi:uncharacterized protein
MMSSVDHRPWPLPGGPWFIAQSWLDLLFAHWPISVADLRPVVPDRLDLDVFAGQAWIGLVPFRMSGVRPRGVPALPGLSRFPELNLRTYVRGVAGEAEARPGVFFFSLDATNRVAVTLGRALFHLPYLRAQMTCETEPGGEVVRYSSRRSHPGVPVGELEARYGPIGPVDRAEPGSLEHWLTERYCLYAVSPVDLPPAENGFRVYRSEVHHEPWPLQPAFADLTCNTIARSMNVPIAGPPRLLHFARRIDVVVWPPRRLV